MMTPLSIETHHCLGAAGMHRLTNCCVALRRDKRNGRSGIAETLREALAVAIDKDEYLSKDDKSLYLRSLGNKDKCAAFALDEFFGIREWKIDIAGLRVEPCGWLDLCEWERIDSLICEVMCDFVEDRSWFEIQSDSDGHMLRVEWVDGKILKWVQDLRWVPHNVCPSSAAHKDDEYFVDV